MSNTTLTLSWTIEGVLTDLDSDPVLTDAGATYGIKRNDTNAVVVAAATPMVRQSTGVYTYSFTDPAADLTYTYSIKYIYNGVTNYLTGVKTGSTADYTSNIYLTIAEFYLRYDKRLTDQLSQDDDTGLVNYYNIAVGIDDAASEFDALIAGRYSLIAGQIPSVVKRWVAIKAIEHTFGRRASMPAYIKTALEWADQWGEDLIMGKITIPTYTTSSVPHLTSSESFTGRSRGDEPAYLDRPVSPTSTDKGDTYGNS